MSHKVLFLKCDCPAVVFYTTFFLHGGISIRALFSKETKVIDTSTCPKQQYPLFCSQLTNGQNYLPSSVFQEPCSISLILAVKEHNCMCSFVKSQMTCCSPKMFLCIFLVPVSVRSQILMTWEKSSLCFPA